MSTHAPLCSHHNAAKDCAYMSGKSVLEAGQVIAQLTSKHMCPHRSKHAPTWKEQQRCVEELLLTASGLRPTDPKSPFSLPPHKEIAASQGSAGQGTPIPGFPELEIGPYVHRAAMRELAKALMVSAVLLGTAGCA